MDSQDVRVLLLVEDEPVDAILMERALEAHGLRYQMTVIEDGIRAEVVAQTACCTQSDFCPDLVFLDWNLPGRSGLEVLRALRDNSNMTDVTVAIVTTSPRLEDMHRAYAAGANYYLVKEVDFHVFARNVGGLLDYWNCTRAW